MKLTSFNCTIEVSKDENGYSNNYYVDITDKGVIISHPYLTQNPEQVKLVNELINQFIDEFNSFNRRIDSFNRDMCLEGYVPKVIQDAPFEESTAESTAESAVPQPVDRGSNSTNLVAHSEQEQERLDMEEEEQKSLEE